MGLYITVYFWRNRWLNLGISSLITVSWGMVLQYKLFLHVLSLTTSFIINMTTWSSPINIFVCNNEICQIILIGSVVVWLQKLPKFQIPMTDPILIVSWWIVRWKFWKWKCHSAESLLIYLQIVLQNYNDLGLLYTVYKKLQRNSIIF